jgi:tetratricopeptide (TPR) repeat protein
MLRFMGWGWKPGGRHRAAPPVICWLLACASTPLPPHVIETREAEEALAVGDVETALEGFERAHVLAPDDPAALRGLALAELRLGRPAAALDWFDRLGRVDAHAFDAELTGARCRALEAALAADLQSESWARAIERAEQTPAAAVCRSPAIGDLAIRAHLAEAARAREANDLATAVDHLEWVLAERPGHPDASLESAELLQRDGSRDDALRVLSEALAQHPNDPRLIEATVELLSQP